MGGHGCRLALPIVLVAGLAVGAIRVAAPPSENAGLDAAGPTDLGSTWVYRTTTDGTPSGLEVDQITGTALLAGGDTGIVEERFFQNLFGNGPCTSCWGSPVPDSAGRDRS